MNAPRLEEHHIRNILSSGYMHKAEQDTFIPAMTDLQHRFMIESQRYLFNHGYSDKAFEMWRQYRNQLTAWYHDHQFEPEPGHLVVIKCQSGKVYQSAAITEVDRETGEVTVCTQPYIPFTSLRFNNRLSMSTSGGYFQSISKTDFTSRAALQPGLELKTFCDWGPHGACADGAIYADVPVSVWVIDDSDGYFNFY